MSNFWDKSNAIQSRLLEVLAAGGVEENEDYNNPIHAFLLGDCEPVEGLEVVSFKGGSDQGSNVSAVFRMDEKLYRARWHYYSHYGYSWDELEFDEVKPVERMVTFYEPV